MAKIDASVRVSLLTACSLQTGDAINRSYGPMIRILSGTAPLIFVVGTGSASRAASASIAARLAHDVLVYYRLDTEILTDDHTLRLQAEGLLGEGNIVVIGSPRDNLFARWMITNTPSPSLYCRKGMVTSDTNS